MFINQIIFINFVQIIFLVSLLSALSTRDVRASQAFTAFGGRVNSPGSRVGARLGSGTGCRAENVKIQQNVCKVDWVEECNTERQKVGERVVYEKVCADREVMDCKTVQMVYQDVPRY